MLWLMKIKFKVIGIFEKMLSHFFFYENVLFSSYSIILAPLQLYFRVSSNKIK